MTSLTKKIDFVLFFSVTGANPNGDPLNGNRPRTDFENFGEMSTECFKRKVRNRMQDLGYEIFVKSADRANDGFESLKDRFEGAFSDLLKKKKKTIEDREELFNKVCAKWLDVRTFGSVFAFKSSKDAGSDGDAGTSIGVRGPVTINNIISVDPIEVLSYQITKSVNGETVNGGKSSDTMGTKHLVKFGLYQVKGSINVQLASKTGFSDEDAEIFKKCLLTVFTNDCSSARPDGSMVVEKLYWFTHDNSCQYPAYKVHQACKVALKEGIVDPVSVDDYNISLDNSEIIGLKYEEY